ncbi:unnamed protein product, partial [Rotaria sp. Silwood1]
MINYHLANKVNRGLPEQSYLNNRQVSATPMISTCYSYNNCENDLKRLNSIISVTRIGFCSWNKYPEKYASVIINLRTILVVFSKYSNLYSPNSFIDTNRFSSPENLGQFLIKA